MLGLDMAMKVWPAQTRYIAVFVRTVVPQQQYRVLENVIVLVLDSQIVIFLREIGIREILISLCRIVRENYIGGLGLAGKHTLVDTGTKIQP